MKHETRTTDQPLVEAMDIIDAEITNRVGIWAIELGFATGHADTLDELLMEVGAQIRELQEAGR